MPKIQVDLNEISDQRRQVEPGKYVARLLACEEGESQAGKPTLIWDWQIIGGDYDGEEVRSWSSTMDEPMPSLKEVLSAFGCEGEVDVDTDDFIGKKVTLTIGIRKYKSRKTGKDVEGSSVVAIEPHSGGSTGKSGGSTSGQRKTGGRGNIPF